MREKITLMDAVNQELDIVIINVFNQGIGKMSIYLPFNNLDHDIADIFNARSIIIEPFCGCYSFAKSEIAASIALEKRMQTKTYVGLYERTTIIPPSNITEVNLISKGDEWYTSLQKTMKDYSDSIAKNPA